MMVMIMKEKTLPWVIVIKINAMMTALSRTGNRFLSLIVCFVPFSLFFLMPSALSADRAA